MNISKVSVRNEGSCNFCKRGKLSECGKRLILPYTVAWKIDNSDGSGLQALICDDCMGELKEATK